MHTNIERELLLARLHYLEAMKSKPGSPKIPGVVLTQIKEQIKEGKVETYLGVEALFNFLIKKLPQDSKKAEELSNELLAFIEQ